MGEATRRTDRSSYTPECLAKHTDRTPARFGGTVVRPRLLREGSRESTSIESAGKVPETVSVNPIGENGAHVIDTLKVRPEIVVHGVIQSAEHAYQLIVVFLCISLKRQVHLVPLAHRSGFVA